MTTMKEPHVNDEQSEANKKVVADLFEIIFGDGSGVERLPDLVGPSYVQHNPVVAQGREGFLNFFQNAIPLPSSGDVGEVRLVGDGDIVVRQEVRERGMLVDIFRLEDGKLVEHWDAYRPNPEKWPFF